MKKYLLVSVIIMVALAQRAMAITFNGNSVYQIVCNAYAGGCVTLGATNNQKTPVYYLTTATTDDETYWKFVANGNGAYAIKNAKTGQYITYNGTYDMTTDRRYIALTDNMNGNYSLWTIEQSGNTYIIRNVGITSHVWDVRNGSYIVGTHEANGGSNQYYTFKEKTITVPQDDGIDVSSWMTATTNSLIGWTTSHFFLNTGAGGSHYSTTGDGAYLEQPFVEYWLGHSTLYNDELSQTIANLPAGKYTLSASALSADQFNGNDVTGVTLYVGDKTQAVNTGNNIPVAYNITTTFGGGDLSLGMKLNSTNANWVAIDNVYLYYHGAKTTLIAGEEEKIVVEGAPVKTESEIRALVAEIKNANRNDTVAMFAALENFRKELLEEVRQLEFLPKAAPLDAVFDSLRINDIGMVYDELNNQYMYPIGLDYFGSNYTATINFIHKGSTAILRINGRIIRPGATYTFNNVSANTSYTLSATDANGNVISSKLIFTGVPIVQIYGDFGYDYTKGLIRVFEPGKEQPKLFNTKMKWRGGITNGNNKHKRNYNVKIYNDNWEKKDKRYFGLRDDNKWILEACQVDMLRIRNRVLTDLWNDFSTKPYYFAEQPKAMTGTRGQFVEVLLNSKYVGMYCMTECIDRKQMKLAKHDTINNVFHGQLWKSKDWSYETFMGHYTDRNTYPMYEPASYDNYSEMWQSYSTEYPDIDDVNPTNWEPLYNAVKLIASGSDEEVSQKFNTYFDYPLLKDYYILMETILSSDNHGKNMFFANYDVQKSPKITFAVWDMDATTGQRWSDEYYHSNIMRPEQDYTEYITNFEHGDYNLFRRMKALNINNFNDSVRYRYRELRKTYLNTDSLINRFATAVANLQKCGVADRESKRWSGDSDIDGKTLNFDTELEYIKDWITRRMNYLDVTRFDIASLPEETNGVKNVEALTYDDYINVSGSSIIINCSKAHSVKIYATNGKLIRVVNAKQGQNVVNVPAGIYIVGNKKVIVL